MKTGWGVSNKGWIIIVQRVGHCFRATLDTILFVLWQPMRECRFIAIRRLAAGGGQRVGCACLSEAFEELTVRSFTRSAAILAPN